MKIKPCLKFITDMPKILAFLVVGCLAGSGLARAEKPASGTVTEVYRAKGVFRLQMGFADGLWFAHDKPGENKFELRFLEGATLAGPLTVPDLRAAFYPVSGTSLFFASVGHDLGYLHRITREGQTLRIGSWPIWADQDDELNNEVRLQAFDSEAPLEKDRDQFDSKHYIVSQISAMSGRDDNLFLLDHTQRAIRLFKDFPSAYEDRSELKLKDRARVIRRRGTPREMWHREDTLFLIEETIRGPIEVEDGASISANELIAYNLKELSTDVLLSRVTLSHLTVGENFVAAFDLSKSRVHVVEQRPGGEKTQREVPVNGLLRLAAYGKELAVLEEGGRLITYSSSDLSAPLRKTDLRPFFYRPNRLAIDAKKKQIYVGGSAANGDLVIVRVD
jgi:hypothetical protein